MKLKKLLMIPIVGLLLLGSIHTAMAAPTETAAANAENTVKAEIPFSVVCYSEAGKQEMKDEKFIIDIKADEATPDAPLPAETSKTLTVDNTNGVFSIDFAEPGDYKYKVSQRPSENADFSLDKTVYDVLISVFVDENGKLENDPTIVITDLGLKKEIIFRNGLDYPTIDLVPFKIVRNEDGKTKPEFTKGHFRFYLQPQDVAQGAQASETPMPGLPREKRGGRYEWNMVGETEFNSIIGYLDEEGHRILPATIYFYQEGKYSYKLIEGVTNGFAPNTTEYTINVNVTRDSETKKLKADVEYLRNGTPYEGSTVFLFVNTPSPWSPCTIDPPVVKTVVDESGQVINDTTGTFTFEMQPVGPNADKAPMPGGVDGQPKEITLTGSTTKVGDGQFGPIHQDSKGVLSEFGEIRYYEEGTWQYQIRELNASGGYTTDSEVYILEVNVTRDKENRTHRATFKVTSRTEGTKDIAISDMQFAFRNTKGNNNPPSHGGNGPGGGDRRPRVTPPPTVPTTPGEVLGATRDAAEDTGRGVLGAVRNPQGQVLGAVRTGDSSAMVTWAVILMLAASGIVGWFNMYQRRKRNI